MFRAHRVIQLMASLFATVVLVMPVSGEAAQENRPEVLVQSGIDGNLMAVSATRRLVALWRAEGSLVYVFDLSTGQLLRKVSVNKGQDVAISADDRYLAVAGRGLEVFDLASGEMLISLGGNYPRINNLQSVKFSTDGRWITVANQTRYDAEKGNEAIHQLPTTLRKNEPDFKFNVAAVQQLAGRSVPGLCGYAPKLSMSDDGRQVVCMTENFPGVLFDMVTGEKRVFSSASACGVTPDGRSVFEFSVNSMSVSLHDIAQPDKMSEAKLLPLPYENLSVGHKRSVAVSFRSNDAAIVLIDNHVQHINLRPLKATRVDSVNNKWRGDGTLSIDPGGQLLLDFHPNFIQKLFPTDENIFRVGETILFQMFDVDSLNHGPFRFIYGLPDSSFSLISDSEVRPRARTTPQGVLLAQRFRDRARVTNLTTGAVMYEQSGLKSIGETMKLRAMVDPTGRKAYFGRGAGDFESHKVEERLMKKNKEEWVSDADMQPELRKFAETILVDLATGHPIQIDAKIEWDTPFFSPKGSYLLGKVEDQNNYDNSRGASIIPGDSVLISTRDGSIIRRWKDEERVNNNCEFSDDEKSLNCESNRFSIPDGKLLAGGVTAFKAPDDSNHPAKSSPNQRWVAYQDKNFNVHLYAMPSGKELLVRHANYCAGGCYTWTPDNRLVVPDRSEIVVVKPLEDDKVEQYSIPVTDCDYNVPTSFGTLVCPNNLKVYNDRTGELKNGSPQNAGDYGAPQEGRQLFINTASAQVLLDVKTGEHLADIVVGTDNWVITLPEGYYTAPRGVNKLIGIRKGNRVYSFDEFDLTLNRPDLVRERLGAPKAIVKALKRAQAKRVQRFGAIDEASRPSVEIDNRSLPLLTDYAQIKVAFNAEAVNGAKLTRAQVYVNGVPTLGRDGVSATPDANGKLSQQLPVELIPGSNRIQVSVFDDKGIESLRDTGVVTRKAAPAPITRYVLAVGVSQYADSSLNLDYAAKDANDLTAALQRSSPGIERTVVKTLTDAEVTRDKLRDARQFFAEAKPQDQVIVFIAGHGLLDDKDDYYFAGHDVDAANPAAKGVPIADIEDLFADTKARRRLLLMDSCHSGEVDHDMEQKLAALPQGVSGTRSLKLKTNTPKPADKDEGESTQAVAYVTELFADLRRGVGATALASASGTELAMESSQYKNGLFTSAVLEALNDQSTDTDETRSIEMSELRDRVAARVRALSNGTQTPSTRVENYDENLLMSAWMEAKEEPVKAAAKGKGKKKK